MICNRIVEIKKTLPTGRETTSCAIIILFIWDNLQLQSDANELSGFTNA